MSSRVDPMEVPGRYLVGHHRPEDDPGEMPHQAPPRLGRALAFGAFAGQVGAALGIPTGLDHRDREERSVQLAIPTPVEAMPMIVPLEAGSGATPAWAAKAAAD